MMLPYLQYINDPSHKWYSCFGVPYATHIWQVAKASSLMAHIKSSILEQSIGMLRKEIHQGLSQRTLYLWLIWHFQKASVTSDQLVPTLNIDLGAWSYFLDCLIEE
jgi:hypothetical protein